MTVSAIQELPNRVNAAADEATIGSTTGVDTNDPTGLTHENTNHYVYLPGVATNYLSVPDEAALDIAGDITVVFRGTPDDFTPSGTNSMLLKLSATAGYTFQILAAGTLRFAWGDGSGQVLAVSTATWASVGSPEYVAATLDVDNGASGYDVRFWYGDNGTSWAQLGATVTGGSTTSISANTAIAQMGFNYIGTAKRLVVADGIGASGVPGGTTVLDINFANDIDTTTDPDAGQTSFTATTGQTVTVNRATSGLTTAVVTRPVALLDGTDDYIQLPASDTPTFTATTGKHTAVLVRRGHNNPVGAVSVLDARSVSGSGSAFMEAEVAGSIRARIRGASLTVTVTTVGTALNNGTLQVVACVVDDGTVYMYNDLDGVSASSSIAAIGATTSTDPRIGSTAYSVGSLSDGEIVANLNFPGVALTEAQLNTLATTLLANDYS